LTLPHRPILVYHNQENDFTKHHHLSATYTRDNVITTRACEELKPLARAALSYSARRYDSAVCCSKMSCDAFLSEALYEADKALEKFK